MEKQKKIFKILILYYALFFLIWMSFEFWGKVWIDNNIHNLYISQLIKSGLIKNLVWTLPAIIIIKKYEASDFYVTLREMFSSKVSWTKYLPLFAIFTLYIVISDYVMNGEIAISPNFGLEQIIIVLFVGITEETVFRGLLLNGMFDEKKKWVCILINALLFLAIHFPKWIAEGTIVYNFITFGFASILVLSAIFSWSFIKSKNILVPICLHMYWDLLMFVLME